MPDASPHPELLRALGRLVRGLSALFWGLPIAFILSVGTASAGWFDTMHFFGFIPSLVATALLLYGLTQLSSFQKQERPWSGVLDLAKLFAIIDCGLSPFLCWWNRIPQNLFFGFMVAVFAISALFFLFTVNLVLLRLGAMLPDEALRLEIRQYTALNRSLLIALMALVAVYLVLSQVLHFYSTQLSRLPNISELMSLQFAIPSLGVQISGGWLIWLVVCLLVLLPLSMTMALTWKTKEVILDNVFGAARQP